MTSCGNSPKTRAGPGGLRRAIVQLGGTPSERTGRFAEKVMAVGSEGERAGLLARGQAWVVRRIDALLALALDPDTTAFLVEMREQHLENIEACHRRAEELQAPPSPPYLGLGFAHLREAHDRIYYGAWRSRAATLADFHRAHRGMSRYLSALSREIERSRCPEGKGLLEKAQATLAQVEAEICAADETFSHTVVPGYHTAETELRASSPDAALQLDGALSYAHRALNALLRQYRMPIHDPGTFNRFYDAILSPFQDVI